MRRAGRRRAQSTARSGCGAVELRDHGLWHLMENARDLHALAQVRRLGFERQRRAALRHRFDVAADAEGAAGALEQHGADLVVFGGAAGGFDQTARHVRVQRIAPLGTVHGDGEEALVELLQNHFTCAHPVSLSLLLLPSCHSGAMRSIELRCASAHRRISRFRVRAYRAPRNDGLSAVTSSPAGSARLPATGTPRYRERSQAACNRPSVLWIPTAS